MKINSIDVSLIIVNWNTKDLLVKCIESIYKETTEHTFEIIVVDNGSSDDSQYEIKRRFHDVILIENSRNLGFAKANNIGIEKAIGRYITLVNSDIVVLDSCIDKMIYYMDSHNEIGAMGPKTINEDLTLRQNCREFPSLRSLFCEMLFLDTLFPRVYIFRGKTLSTQTYEQNHEAEVISGCFFMVRREALDQVGYLDERFYIYGEDVDWCKRFHSHKWKVIFYADAISIHHGGGSASKAPLKFLMEKENADLKYWKKHHGHVAVFLYLLLRITYHCLYTLGWMLIFVCKKSKRKVARKKIISLKTKLHWILFRNQLNTGKINN